MVDEIGLDDFDEEEDVDVVDDKNDILDKMN